MRNRFAVCLANADYEDDLEPRKVYLVLDDPVAEPEGLLRVVDESGEDYLYPAEMFELVELPESAAASLFERTS